MLSKDEEQSLLSASVHDFILRSIYLNILYATIPTLQFPFLVIDGTTILVRIAFQDNAFTGEFTKLLLAR